MGTTFRISHLIAAFAMLAAMPASAHESHELVGGHDVLPGEVVVSGAVDGRRDRVDLAALTITINEQTATMDSAGHFAVRMPRAPYYLVTIDGDAIFRSVQTFANAEIADPQCECLSIPAIEVVARKEGRVELFFGGDSMAGRRYFEARSGKKAVLGQATLDEDMDQLLSAIKPYFAATDLVSINLESVVAAQQPGPATPKTYVFFSPPELPQALARAGIDHVSLGNNHTADYRDAGVRTTIDALDAAGVAWSGAGMDQDEAERASRFDIGGQKLALYGFVGWKGTTTPNQTASPTKAGAAWGARTVIERVTRREWHAGYKPIMQIHGSPEYGDRPSELYIPRFRTAIQRGAPVAIGHHPHVTHGIEIYRGGLIASSLGNFLFDQDHPRTQVSYGLKVWLEKGKFLRAEAVPIQILDYRPVPATGGMREAVLRRLHWLSAELGTKLDRSGGHSVVWRERPRGKAMACADPGSFQLRNFAAACGDETREYGRNIVPRGDFDNSVVGAAKDRFWASRNAGVDLRIRDASNGYLAVMPESAGKDFYLYSRSYIRDIYAHRFTLKTRIQLPRAASVELIIKERPRKGASATSSVRGDVVGRTMLPGSAEWQDLQFEFSRPEDTPGTARGYRFILKFQFADGREQGGRTVELDDLALVEWPDDTGQAGSAQAWRWTHSRPKGAGPSTQASSE